MKISNLKYIFLIAFLLVFTLDAKNDYASANVPHDPNVPNVPIDKQNEELLNLALELPNYLNTEIVPLSAYEKICFIFILFF